MNKVPESIRKELAALASKPESEIDFSDIPVASRQDWHGAVRGKFYRPVKQQLTVRVDAVCVGVAQEPRQGLSKSPERHSADGHAR